MLSFVNNHRYFIVQIETRVYIDVVGKGWHNYLDKRKQHGDGINVGTNQLTPTFFGCFLYLKFLKYFCYVSKCICLWSCLGNITYVGFLSVWKRYKYWWTAPKDISHQNIWQCIKCSSFWLKSLSRRRSMTRPVM